ncbi:hypothetical protein [Lactobacillus sp. ESL0681]|uniref:hypothetical protein n=1 Tax=Lactobacillus sp. ESL0681 TaxID=2983211 RepID=UPI0023F73C76|nr:hypothetical protein [Lactobacillus sp. ESL0681]WEV40940.1 hypothetical protein OZX59_03205 [Lactobacillus sp. ESL0681]
MSMIEFHNVQKFYKKFQVLYNVNLLSKMTIVAASLCNLKRSSQQFLSKIVAY